MDGAPVDRYGNVDANQTYCDELGYDENLPISSEARTAAKEARLAAEEKAKELGYKNLKDYYVDIGLDVSDF